MVPHCECWEPDPKWGKWKGCDMACSDVPVERTRKRKCEKNRPELCPKSWRLCCPIMTKNKRYYDQEQFEPCIDVPLCRK